MGGWDKATTRMIVDEDDFYCTIFDAMPKNVSWMGKAHCCGSNGNGFRAKKDVGGIEVERHNVLLS